MVGIILKIILSPFWLLFCTDVITLRHCFIDADDNGVSISGVKTTGDDFGIDTGAVMGIGIDIGIGIGVNVAGVSVKIIDVGVAVCCLVAWNFVLSSYKIELLMILLLLLLLFLLFAEFRLLTDDGSIGADSRSAKLLIKQIIFFY